MDTPARDPPTPAAERPTPTTPHGGVRDDDATIVSGISGDPSAGATIAGDARYEFVREVARGGMGIILQTRDQQLHREIACKVLLPEHAGSAELAQRFVEEAQIAGQLQHPGIVPVYDSGRLADDRPYFTMRLVKGRTLTAILRERKSPSDDLPRCLGIFEQVCQAMAYAHARGVIHRDLKPSNVMVGRFGEVQVMDWGLAKVLGERPSDAPQPRPAPPTDVSIVQTPRTRDSDSGSSVGAETSAGSILGTVSYMAPEQARGNTDLLDKRADVFGLGAVLCEILTGKPPYTGDDSKQLYHRAACGDLREALDRLDQCGADPELVALVKRCLAVAPTDRPADAGEVAQAVRAYLDGTQERLRRAQLDHATAEARAVEAKATAAAERRAKRLTGGLAAAVLLLGLAGVALWRSRDVARARQERELAAHRAEVLERDQKAALILQESLTLQGQEQWTAALASARRAADLIDKESAPDLRDRIARQTTDLQLLNALDRARIDSLGVDVKESRISHEGLPERFGAAFRQAGLDLHELGPEKVAVQIKQSRISERLVAALWFWSNTDPSAEWRQELRALLQSVDQTSPARRVVDALDAGDAAALRTLVNEMDYSSVPADMAWVVSALLSRKDRTLSRDWLLQAQRVHPSDFWINFNLGHHLMQEGALPEAIGYFRVALAAHPRHAGVMLNLAVSHMKQQAFPQAELFYREAVRAQPDYANAHLGLGNALRFQDRHEAAADAYRAVLALVGENHNAAWANASVGLAESLLALNDPSAADLLRNVTEEYPRHTDAWLVMATLYYNEKSWTESEHCYRKALQIDARSAPAQAGLAATLLEQQRFADAEAAFRVARQFLGTDRGPAWDYATLGLVQALTAQGKENEAARLSRELGSPTNVAVRESLSELAEEHRKNNRWRDAGDSYRQLLTLDPDNIQVHIDLADVLVHQAQRTEAAAEYRTALKLLGNDRGALWQSAAYGLAGIQNFEGEYEESIRLLESLLEVSPRHLGALFRLGDAHRRQRNWESAADAFRAMIEIAPTTPPAHVDLASALQGQGLLAEAEAEYRTALDLVGSSRDTAWERACVGLAVVAAAQGRADEALQELNRSTGEASSPFAGKMMLVHYHGYRRDWAGVGHALLAATEAATDEYVSIHPMRAAAAFVLAGDVEGYRRACAFMLERYGDTTVPFEADRVVKTCCLSRHYGGDLSQIQRLAEIAVTGQEQHSWYVYFALSRSLAALRAGEWEEALRWSRNCRERSPTFATTAAPAWLVDALAQQRLGHADESRQALAAALEMRNTPTAVAASEDPLQVTWGDWMIFDALRMDIEALLPQ
jgi:serine/threonine-protein kinase